MLPLQTRGRHITNSLGKIIRLRGTAIRGGSNCWRGVPQHWGNKERTQVGGGVDDCPGIDCPGYLPNSFNLLRKMGANAVRLGINPYCWTDTNVILKGTDYDQNLLNEINLNDKRLVHSQAEYIENQDMLVRELTARGIYSILDWHGASPTPIDLVPYRDFMDNYKDVWLNSVLQIIEHYKDNPAVCGVEVTNEPRGFVDDYPYTGYWWDFCLEFAQAVHEVNPNLLIIVASCKRDLDPPINWWIADAGYKMISNQFAQNPLPEPNIVYDFHQHFPMHDQIGLPGHDIDFWLDYVDGNYEKAKQEYEDFLYKVAFRVLKLGLPIITMEWNIKRFDYKTYEKLPYDSYVVLKDTLDIYDKYGVGFMWWPWGGSVGYPWDCSSEANALVYSTKKEPLIWDNFSNHGKIIKNFLTQIKRYIPFQWVDIKEMHLSKIKPSPSDGYEIIQIWEWNQIKLWMEYRIAPDFS